MGLKDFIKSDLNNLLYREYRLNRKVKKHLSPYYSEQAPAGKNEKKIIIFMADGRKRHGGLADRLRGIVSTYKYCLEHNLEFRIHFTSPFELRDLLVPNAYDWEIRDDEISYNSSFSLPVYIDSSHYPEADMIFQRKMAEKMLSKDYKQIHVYTNMYFADDEFGYLFSQLFKPAPVLQMWIDENLSKLGNHYISLSFRFQNLFGDFADGSTVYSQEEQKALLDKCIAKIQSLHDAHPQVNKILVTADSEHFLKEIAKMDFVYLLPGRVGHMDHGSEQGIAVHMKTFLDFFVLSHSKKIYLLVTGKMYKSGFAKRAAKLQGVPFVEVNF
ncbi:hypothetical protein [Bacteroides sp.]|uniref:hypothetical protein n=1 Tax=Bacteroides sp. TaxID=29523 RepID=UPI00260C1F45|nr:hypothetical protein [Bacteroides sp.]MDD3039670.1 hypothetical protein [Bacteroides sp.]